MNWKSTVEDMGTWFFTQVLPPTNYLGTQMSISIFLNLSVLILTVKPDIFRELFTIKKYFHILYLKSLLWKLVFRLCSEAQKGFSSITRAPTESKKEVGRDFRRPAPIPSKQIPCYLFDRLAFYIRFH